MAIEDGMAIVCSDLQAVGGTRYIAIREWVSTDTVVFTTSNSQHSIASIIDTGGANASWGVYESRIESSSLTVSGTNEGKEFTTYECTLSFFVPGLTKSQFRKANDFGGKCLMVLVVDNNDTTTAASVPPTSYLKNKVIGVSHTLENQDNDSRTQQYARLVSIEGGTGAAFSDEIGITVTIAATQMEIPRNYTGSIVVDADGTGLVTAA
tara:strand:- start:274 stop:900 length:627 start_codon:yes stop_codon:yes gene_type:complete